MSQVDKLQEAEEHVAQMREDAERREREARAADLRRDPMADTAAKAHTTVSAPLAQVRVVRNMRVGPLPELHELAVSIKETGLLQPPLVRATGEDGQPYELLAGHRRYGAMLLLDEADGAREDWRFTVVDGISSREALTMQFAENFHQNKPEPVEFARAAHAIMREDPGLTAADVSRMVGAPAGWTRRSLRLLDLPAGIVERVERGDLAFTIADLVRRKIASGDVSAERAEELVEQHAAGEISGPELKFGVGYVPPPPPGYEERSRELDEARRRAERGERASDDDAEQRDWDADGRDVVVSRGPGAEPEGGDDAPRGRGGIAVEDLDAYLAGRLLVEAATDERRAMLRITSDADAHAYAFSLRPAERLGLLRTLAAELLDDDPRPPAALAAARSRR